MRKLILTFVLSLVLAVFALAQNATVTVIHGIDGRDLGAAQALPVDVVVNGDVALPNFTFGTTVTTALPAATYNIQVRLAGTSTTVINANVPLAAGENATIIAHLSAAGAPTASKFTNRIQRIPGLIPITYHHTAAAPAVDVYQSFRFLFLRTVAGLQNGRSRTAWASNRHVAVFVTPANRLLPVLGPAELSLEPRRSYFVYVVGSAAGAAGNTLSPIVISFPNR